MQEMLIAQVTLLEAKVTRLEALEVKVQQQDSIISAMKRERSSRAVAGIDAAGSERHSAGSNSTLRQGASKIPRSCADLRSMGHVSSGLFSVMGAKSVEMVFCDFCKQSTDLGKESILS